MKANQMAVERTTNRETPEVIVLQMIASMEALAAEEDWHGIKSISEKLRRIVLQIPDNERRDTLLAAQRSVDKLQAMALEARHRVSDKLSGIKRGKDATRAYGSSTGA